MIINSYIENIYDEPSSPVPPQPIYEELKNNKPTDDIDVAVKMIRNDSYSHVTLQVSNVAIVLNDCPAYGKISQGK